jgi:hypothetical protein
MSLYCLKHKVFAYKNHKCSPLSLVPITKECRGIADKLYALGVEPLCVSHFTNYVTGSYTEHYISFCIELRKGYPTTVLGDLYSGWKFYTETVTDDHTPLLVLGFSETFVYEGGQMVEERIKQIIKDFEDYLTTFDPQAIKSIITLMYS